MLLRFRFLSSRLDLTCKRLILAAFSSEERLAVNIHEALNDPSIFLYLTCLDYILPKVNAI